jgi:hypothetical protein
MLSSAVPLDAMRPQTTVVSDTGPEIFGIPVPIVVVLVPFILGPIGFLIKRRFFPQTSPGSHSSKVEPSPTATLSATAHAYVGVVSRPQISSAPSARAAETLLAASKDAREKAPRAADLASSLAAETDPEKAASLLANLDQALQSKRWPRRPFARP